MATGTSGIYETMMRCGRNRDRYKMLRPANQQNGAEFEHENRGNELTDRPVFG